MITIEKLHKAIEEIWTDTNFILNKDILDYTDLLEEHRTIISELWLSFWIAELMVAEWESETIVYTSSNNDKTINILNQWLPDCESLEEYVDWLNRMEEQALIINK